MKVISVNSYKGGACRTTTCYNTIPYLAERMGASARRPIILLDLDLDSMGLTKLLSTHEFEQTYSANSLFDDSHIVNENFRDSGFDNVIDSPYFKKYLPVGAKFGLGDNRAVLFLGADAKAKPISDEGFARMSTSSPLSDLIALLEDIGDDDRPCAFVMDCAAGQQKTTQMAVSLAEKFIMCMRPTTQFRSGTADYLLDALPGIFRKRNASAPREVILLPTAVSKLPEGLSDRELELLVSFRKSAYKGIEMIADQVQMDNMDKREGKYKLNTRMADTTRVDVGIPEIERFKWKEEVLVSQIEESDLTASERDAIAQYRLLAELLTGEVA